LNALLKLEDACQGAGSLHASPWDNNDEEANMQRRLPSLVLFVAAIATTPLYQPRSASATMAEGYKSTSLAMGRFGEIDVSSYFPRGPARERNEQLWTSLQQTKGPSDLYIQNNVWQPGGTTGWHTHPGHSLIIVTEGTVTEYASDDPECKPHIYTQGMGFVDHGGDHIHLIRNEGTVQASTIALQLIPQGTERRIDAAAPQNCHF
jgi:hypothetical protein